MTMRLVVPRGVGRIYFVPFENLSLKAIRDECTAVCHAFFNTSVFLMITIGVGSMLMRWGKVSCPS